MRRVLGLAALVIAAIAIYVWTRHVGVSVSVSDQGKSTGAGTGSGDGSGSLTPTLTPAPTNSSHPVTLAGHVVDEVDRSPVAGAEVVIRGPLGEASTVTRPDGAFSIEVARGAYHVGVRGGGVLSAGAEDRERLETGPNAAIVGLPDDTLMPVVDARASIANLELALPREATIAGTVSDRDGHRIAHAIVRAQGALRPAFGSDVGETDEAGNFTLVVPAGRYRVEAGAADFARSLGPVETTAIAHATARVALVLAKGCEIRGRVLRADGKPAADGAIERRSEERNLDFGPAGRIDPDGSFRWSTLDEGDVTLRAWPWKSAATDERTFECRDGARFDGVVLRVRDEPAAVHGTLVDAAGAPVPFGYVDVQALDPRLPSQQERADAEGRFEIHDMPFGRYQLAASAPGRGIAVTTVAAPRDEAVELRLAGTGRVEGTTTALANGTLEIALEACFDALDLQHRPMPIAHEPRLVTVRGGRFAIDDAPACDLLLAARWHEQRVEARVAVSASQIAHVELEVGPPHEKLVHGTVLDRDAHPVANAHVTSVFEGRRSASVTDAAGQFTVKSFAGAELTASDGARHGDARVGRANVPDEQVDVVIDRVD